MTEPICILKKPKFLPSFMENSKYWKIFDLKIDLDWKSSNAFIFTFDLLARHLACQVRKILARAEVSQENCGSSHPYVRLLMSIWDVS